MRFLVMFVTAVCVLFLIKLRWPKKKTCFSYLGGVHEKSVTAHVSHDIPLTEIRRSAFGILRSTFGILRAVFAFCIRQITPAEISENEPAWFTELI